MKPATRAPTPTNSQAPDQKGTPYPELRDDHDLSQKEQALRNKLRALYPTIEDAADALGVDLEQFKPEANIHM